MANLTVNNTPIEIKEYDGQRVVTFKDIDSVHGRPDGTARRNFNANKEHLIDGVDYYKIQPNEIRTVGIKSPNGGTVVTETGYLMLVKSFTDDLAWDVQRTLVNCYFRVKNFMKAENVLKKEIEYITPKERLSIAKLIASAPKDRLPAVKSILQPLIGEDLDKPLPTSSPKSCASKEVSEEDVIKSTRQLMERCGIDNGNEIFVDVGTFNNAFADVGTWEARKILELNGLLIRDKSKRTRSCFRYISGNRLRCIVIRKEDEFTIDEEV